MSRFQSLTTHVVVSVDDSKDERFASGWKPYDGEEKRPVGRPKKSD
jgi:hypothetical protein